MSAFISITSASASSCVYAKSQHSNDDSNGGDDGDCEGSSNCDCDGFVSSFKSAVMAITAKLCQWLFTTKNARRKKAEGNCADTIFAGCI
jgi:hypothetical protein